MTRTAEYLPWLQQLVEAALCSDQQRLQVVLMTAIRSLRKSDPGTSDRLSKLLSQYTTEPNVLRGRSASPPPPSDSEEGMALVRLPDTSEAPAPVLSPPLREAIDQFMAERHNGARLLREGFVPPSSMLVIGAPGTGKTMLARWLANQLHLPLVVQDLATSMSSLLGKTGFNLRRTLDYARSHPCLLLLDEFDAIAKRRDDVTELGELKRIVNVLLKELEEWPVQSVLVAATNHPDLLDPAISRRFHLTLALPLPDESERTEIMERVAGRFASELPDGVLAACSRSLDKRSGSDVDRVMQAAIRRHISRRIPLAEALIHEVLADLNEYPRNRAFGALIRTVHQASKDRLSVRDLAALFGKSPSTVQYHLKKGA